LPEHRAAAAAGGGCGSHESAGCGSAESAGCGGHDGAGCGPHEGGGVCGTAAAAPVSTEPRTDLVAVRRRGAGTDLAPNA
ncbi:MAG: biotin synthase BioB, partial [Streptomycetaceae bacterium]|nr:biotin synthase BioB [Streptomycetaceae bacterium]